MRQDEDETEYTWKIYAPVGAPASIANTCFVPTTAPAFLHEIPLDRGVCIGTITGKARDFRRLCDDVFVTPVAR